MPKNTPRLPAALDQPSVSNVDLLRANNQSAADIKRLLDLIDDHEFALLRGIGIGALANERSHGKGPPYQKTGRKIFYPLAEVRKFLTASTVHPVNAPTLIDGGPRRRRAGGAP
ncbi:MAG: hypothetical protein ACLQO1_25240 [Steroidobacteraceae bacterium]